MSTSPPDRLMSPDGRSGWYAFPPDGHRPSDDEPWEGPRSGSLIRFMAEEGVDIPLWGEDGLIFVEPEELVREWGVSQDLATEIQRWGHASQGPPGPELDAEAARLIRLLRTELEYRFPIVYKP